MLTIFQIKSLKPQSKQYDVSDGNGLFLRVNPSGTKVWRINKSVNGRRFVKQLGEYPQLSIQDARKALAELTHSEGKIDNTLNGIYQDWLALKKQTIIHWDDIDEKMQKYIIPTLGSLPFSIITPPQIIKILRENLESRGKLETIKRICGIIKEIEVYAVNSGRVNALKFQGLQKVFASPATKRVHRPSVHPSKLPQILPKLKEDTLNAPIMWRAIQIALYTLLRPAEYCALEWQWVKGDVIDVPAEIMKMKKSHYVPISGQLSELLECEHQGVYILPSMNKQGEHIRTAAMEVFFKRHGLKDILVPHGIRSIGRTWMTENDIPHDVAEMCLAHKVGSAVELAYNRTDLIAKRRDVMQRWCDYVYSCIS